MEEEPCLATERRLIDRTKEWLSRTVWVAAVFPFQSCSDGPSWKRRRWTPINQSIRTDRMLTLCSHLINLQATCSVDQWIGGWGHNWEIRWWEPSWVWQQRGHWSGQRCRVTAPSSSLPGQEHFSSLLPAAFKEWVRGFLVAQWLSICLPMQGTRVRALVWEDPTCRGATKPVCHNYWACALEPTSHNYWARVPQLLKPMHLEPVLCNKKSHRSEKPTHRNEE